jgi:hypothetical protein
MKLTKRTHRMRDAKPMKTPQLKFLVPTDKNNPRRDRFFHLSDFKYTGTAALFTVP